MFMAWSPMRSRLPETLKKALIYGGILLVGLIDQMTWEIYLEISLLR